MFAEIINQYGAQLIGTMLVSIFGVFGMLIRQMVAKYLDTDTKRTMAKIVVQFVEQTYKDLHGAEKLDQDMTTLSELLAQKNVKASACEMRVLIEAAVAEFNNVFNKQESGIRN